MLKTQAVLEVKKGERSYSFYISQDAPLGEIHDALHDMQMFVIKTMAERAAPVEPKEEPKAEVTA